MVGRWAVLCFPVVFGIGCMNAKIIERDPLAKRAVVAVPDNTNSWPSRNRRHAEELMAKEFPGGYVIEKEQYVVTGQITHTSTNTERHGVPVLSAVGLGPTFEDQATTTKAEDVKEWRIWFRAKDAPPVQTVYPAGGPAPPGGVIPAKARSSGPN